MSIRDFFQKHLKILSITYFWLIVYIMQTDYHLHLILNSALLFPMLYCTSCIKNTLSRPHYPQTTNGLIDVIQLSSFCFLLSCHWKLSLSFSLIELGSISLALHHHTPSHFLRSSQAQILNILRRTPSQRCSLRIWRCNPCCVSAVTSNVLINNTKRWQCESESMLTWWAHIRRHYTLLYQLWLLALVTKKKNLFQVIFHTKIKRKKER